MTGDPHDVRTLAVDCGGGGIKANVLDASGTAHAAAVRVPTPYPLPPDLLVETVAGIAATLPPADRVTVGMPGMIRRGVVVYTPHYVTRSGPRSRVDPALVEAWTTSTSARPSSAGSASRRSCSTTPRCTARASSRRPASSWC